MTNVTLLARNTYILSSTTLPPNSRVKSEAEHYIFIIKFDLRKPRDTNVS